MFSTFMWDAWISGTAVATVAGLVGFFVVLRGSAFAAHTIPNGAFAGAAGAGFLGLNPLWGTVSVSLVSAWLIGSLSRRSRRDVVTALTLVLMLAVGSAFLALTTSYAIAVQSLLFGEILGVTSAQLVPVIAVVLGCAVMLGAIFRPLLYQSITPELAQVRGVHKVRIDILFLLLVALVTAITVPIVGALLTFSLMIGPPAAARLWTNRPMRAMGLSVLFSVVTMWLALASSYQSNWPIGFFVGTLAASSYLSSRLVVPLLRRRSRTIAVDLDVI